MRRAAIGAALAMMIACGGTTVHRSMDLFIGGLSGRAETLVILVFPASTGQGCAGIELANVQGLDAPVRAQWRRSESSEGRRLSLEAVDEDRVVVVAYSEDASGAAIQIACTEIDYAEIESPDVSLQLSARPRDG